MYKKPVLIIVIIALLISLFFAIFQIYNPVINGTVFDESKNPLQGATVKINGRTATSDSSGKFRLRIHKNIKLNIEATKDGYINYSKTLLFKDISPGLELTLLRATKLNLIKKKGVLTIGVSKNHLRQYERDRCYPDSSIDIEIWKLISRRIGVKLNVKFYKDTELVNALKNKSADLILANEQFIKNSGLLIGIPYYPTDQVACIKVKNTSIKSANDLMNKKIGVAKDSQAGIEAVKSIKGVPVLYDSYTWAMYVDLKPFEPIKVPIRINKPIKAEIDAFLLDKFVAEYSEISKDQYKLIDIKANHDDFVFAGLLSDKDLIEKINNIIKDSKQYDKIQYSEIVDNCFWMYMD
jgi:ABC-type amino acid transport substrate-binding protein